MREWAPGETFGDRIRVGRARKDLTLRQAAERIGRSPSYLSDIEHGRRTASEEVARQLASLLDLDVDDLLASAGRLPEEVADYLRATPEVTRLFRVLEENGASTSDVRALIDRARTLGGDRRRASDK